MQAVSLTRPTATEVEALHFFPSGGRNHW